MGRAGEILGWTPRVSLVTGLAQSVRFFTDAQQGEESLFAEVGSHEKRPDF
jgi:hypothetical protein